MNADLDRPHLELVKDFYELRAGMIVYVQDVCGLFRMMLLSLGRGMVTEHGAEDRRGKTWFGDYWDTTDTQGCEHHPGMGIVVTTECVRQDQVFRLVDPRLTAIHNVRRLSAGDKTRKHPQPLEKGG